MNDPQTVMILGAGIYGYICFWTGLLLARWWLK